MGLCVYKRGNQPTFGGFFTDLLVADMLVISISGVAKYAVTKSSQK